jgi:hypothetical protein
MFEAALRTLELSAGAQAATAYRAIDFLNSDPQRIAHLLKDPDGMPARMRALFWGRRSGKTTLVQHEMIEAALAHPDCAVVYVGPTINLAIKTVWDELVKWSAPIGGVANESNHWIKFPNGAVIYILGSENKKTIDRIRGIKRIVYLCWDEQQNYASDFAIYALTSVIFPGLADEGGRLVLNGTGGPETGHWFNIVTYGNAAGKDVERDPALDFTVSRGPTMWDNPVIGDRADHELAKVCRLRGVTAGDPYIRREYGSPGKGIEFTTDSERSVFPKIVAKAMELPSGGRYVIGGDVGSVDCSSAVVYYMHPHLRGLVMVTSEKRKTPGASDQIALFREYAERYQPLSSSRVLIAVDPGGGGKGVITDLGRLGGFWEVMPAEKNGEWSKGMTCRLMADDVRSGFLTVLPGHEAAPKGLALLEWEPGKEGEKLRGHADDAADGAVYGWRLARKLFDSVYQGDAPNEPPPEVKADLAVADEILEGDRWLEEMGF